MGGMRTSWRRLKALRHQHEARGSAAEKARLVAPRDFVVQDARADAISAVVVVQVVVV